MFNVWCLLIVDIVYNYVLDNNEAIYAREKRG